MLTTGAEAQIKVCHLFDTVSEKLESLVRALGQVEFELKKPVKYSKFKNLHILLVLPTTEQHCWLFC